MYSTWQAGSYGPSLVKDVNTPKQFNRLRTLLFIWEAFYDRFFSMQAHLLRSTGSTANHPPGQDILITVKVVNALWAVFS